MPLVGKYLWYVGDGQVGPGPPATPVTKNLLPIIGVGVLRALVLLSLLTLVR